jgi:ArsR family metal-binding transcriptional regulator/ferredoxin
MEYITPLIVMAVFAAVVAGVLGSVSKALTIEGEAKVRVANNGHVMVFPLASNLMNGLGDKGYALMAQCAGGGTCATCRVRVVEGIDDPNPAMLGPISPKLQKEGWILSCQTSLMADCEIELFDALVTAWPDEIESEDGAVAEPVEILPENVAALRDTMPGFDCGMCGYDTCNAYAQAIVDGGAGTEACLPGGAPVLARLNEAASATGVVSLSPKAQKIRNVLPGLDCDECGHPTCNAFAEAVANGDAATDACTPGGEPIAIQVKQIKEN